MTLGGADSGATTQALELAEQPVYVKGQPFRRVTTGEEAPPKRRVVRYRVLVEDGLEAEAEAFTRAVDEALSDPNGWAAAGREFIRVEERRPEVTVLLATPSTVDKLCAPLRTVGKLSCGRNRKATLNLDRWQTGIEHWGDDLDGYRRYMINHEVGHLLGVRHVKCPGRGQPAPVMQQQTKGLAGCEPKSLPSPAEIHVLRQRWTAKQSD
jgi:hypothetical protein